ncbi:hypothetical protein MHTCC0001_31980 [Flavobacteriaceae bacterium MHTCC 0001]
MNKENLTTYRKYQYANIEMTESEIETTKTAYFQFAKSKDEVYVFIFDGFETTTKTKLKNADPKTFEVMGQIFAKDKNNVYFFGKPKRNFDANSFQLLFENNSRTWVWSKDKNNLYRWDKPIKNIDVRSFEILNKFWGKDKNHIYCFATQKIYKNMDTQTFEIIKEHKAKDKNFTYNLTLNPKWLSEEALNKQTA